MARAGETVQWLRALTVTVLSEDLDLIPSNHDADTQPSVSPFSGDLTPSLGPYRYHADTRGTYIPAGNPHPHK